MDFLAAEIERMKGSLDKNKGQKRPRFMRRGDLAETVDDSTEGSAAAAPFATPPVVGKKRARHDSEEGSRPSASAAAPSPELEDSSSEVVVARLRRLREPVRLFGESDRERLLRLSALELQRGDDTQLAAGYEQFSRKNPTAHTGERGRDGGDGAAGSTRRPSVDAMTLRGDAFEDQHDFVRGFYKALLHKWQDEIAARTPEEAASVPGRALTSSVAQLAAYTKPFFKLCKKRALPAGMLPNIVNMVNLCLQREYAKAESCYFDLSIGRAAWPMGVTTTGIHNRASRTKLFENNVAHVMNDEQQRKYITSLKRLMTECERWYPTDPSKSTSTAGLAQK